MKANMGSTDRIIRLFAASLIAVLYFTNVISGTIGIIALILAAVFLITSAISFCPLYTVLGIKTCQKK
jgi:hypothetical protein